MTQTIILQQSEPYMKMNLYVTYRSNSHGYCSEFYRFDPYGKKLVRTYDGMLHRTLTKIFSKRRLTSDQIKELLRTSEDTDQLIKLILKRQPTLSEIFPLGNKVSLLWITVILCYQKSAEFLLRSGADVNSDYYFGKKWPILHMLLTMYPSSWNERFIGLVMEHGADLEARGPDGYTALHLAVEQGRVKEAKMFLAKGADVNVANNVGQTPLLTAVMYEDSYSYDTELMWFLKHGADVPVREPRRMNALHYLAWAFTPIAHPNWTKVFFEKGTSLGNRDVFRQHQPLDLVDCLDALVGQFDMIKLILDHGANVNARVGDGGYFPLYLAAERNRPTLVFTLLQRGANVDLKTNEGHTALHIACHRHLNEIIKMLLFFGANIFAEDYVGRTPFSFMHASDRSNSSIQLMLRMLALKKSCLEPSIELKDERRIKDHSDQWDYYRGCIEEINIMKSERLTKTCTLFDIMNKCQCQIAVLMRNREFENKLKPLNLKVFVNYGEYLLEAIDVARAYYSGLLESENLIDEATYNMWPHMIVRKVARYVTGCKECEVTKIVHESRGSSDNSKDNSNALRGQ